MEYKNSSGGIEPLFLDTDFFRRPFQQFADEFDVLDNFLNNGSSLFDDFPQESFPNKSCLSDYLDDTGSNQSLLDVKEFLFDDELKAIPDSPTSPCDLSYEFLESIDIDELYRDVKPVPSHDFVQPELNKDENSIPTSDLSPNSPNDFFDELRSAVIDDVAKVSRYESDLLSTQQLGIYEWYKQAIPISSRGPVQTELYSDGNISQSQAPVQIELYKDENISPSSNPDQSPNSPNDSSDDIYSAEIGDFPKVPEDISDSPSNQQSILYEHAYAKPPETIADEFFGNLSPSSVDSGISTTSTDIDDFVSEQSTEHDTFECVDVIVVNDDNEPTIHLSPTTTEIETSSENIRYAPYKGKPKSEQQKSRKKEHNRKSASKYRMKKKEKIGTIFEQADKLEKQNEELKVTIKDLQTEIGYLKKLMIEVASVRFSKTKDWFKSWRLIRRQRTGRQ